MPSSECWALSVKLNPDPAIHIAWLVRAWAKFFRAFRITAFGNLIRNG